MRSALPLLAVLSLAPLAGCGFDCNASTCAAGCCQDGKCYQGVTGMTGGVACDGTSSGGGSSSGGGAGGGGGGGGGGGCTSDGLACNSSSECCGGNCGYGACQPGSCGTYDTPCNASAPCCINLSPASSTNLGYVCNTSRERCDFCGALGYDCSSMYSDPCCPGLSCVLKAGYTSIYECR